MYSLCPFDDFFISMKQILLDKYWAKRKLVVEVKSVLSIVA